jgi:hypothetical protein
MARSVARKRPYVAPARLLYDISSVHFLRWWGGGMPISRLLRGSNLPAAEIEILNKAFDRALKQLGLVDRNDPVTEIVAAKILAVANRGLRDPVEIYETALKELRA